MRRGENAMTFTTITHDLSPRGVATITLNRPERGNALNQAAIDDIGEYFAQRAVDKETRVIVLRGAGKHFCAGADLGGRGGEEIPPRFTLATMIEAVDICPKPVIAVVQGAAIGGVTAVLASFPGWYARAIAINYHGQTKTGFVEDAAVLAGAAAIVRR